MTESPSKTSNHQRLKEMMCHLTPKMAVIPYNLCFDDEGNLWVASKGGLFKFSSSNFELIYERKNEFPKKIGPYTQVLHYKSQIIYVQSEDKSALTEFLILDIGGKVLRECFIGGRIQSIAINGAGELFLTKQFEKDADESFIHKSDIECPISWDEFSSTFDFCFQSICSFDNHTLAVAVVNLPPNIYSKQSIKWVDSNNGTILGSFSSAGKDDGLIYFPRCMHRFQNGLLVFDKTGRIQKFNRSGEFEEISAKIDDYIGNGFALKENQAVIACSGIVLDQKGETICDDWIESIKLDGSTWARS